MYKVVNFLAKITPAGSYCWKDPFQDSYIDSPLTYQPILISTFVAFYSARRTFSLLERPLLSETSSSSLFCADNSIN